MFQEDIFMEYKFEKLIPHNDEPDGIKLKILSDIFSVCQVASLDDINIDGDYMFVLKTEGEISLLCKTVRVPKNHLKCEDGWKVLKIDGVFDFTVYGVLAKILELLAYAKTPVLVMSAYDTDYILIKEDKLDSSIKLLQNNGYEVE